MRGDDAVERLGDRGEARHMKISPQSPRARGQVRDQVKDGLGPAVTAAAFEELNSLPELGDGNVRKAARSGLIRRILDAIRLAGIHCEVLPVTDPYAAERA